VQTLRTELEATKKEVSAAEVQNAQYSGGLVKALIAVRLEVLKTNEALIQQRIHAIESGAKVSIQTVGTKIDLDRAKQLEEELRKQELKVAEAESKASLYSGGLVGATAAMGAATERNSLAMLRQQYLISKHGLASPQQGASASNVPAQTAATPSAPEAVAGNADQKLREQILEVTLLRKQYAKQDYQHYVFFDIAFNPKGLDKPARAIKGALIFTDLFGEQKFVLRWTIEKPVTPGAIYTEKGSGFEYNLFIDSHQWVRSTEKDNMKVRFRVDNILYQDGTSRSFE
jgi:GTPase SAR1 family protein